jgi:hypothetical protein
VNIKRRLDALEARQGGANPFRSWSDADILAALATMAVASRSWPPFDPFVDRDALGPPNPSLAHLSDTDLVQQRDAARAEAATQRLR